MGSQREHESRFVTASEVAEKCGVSHRTVLRWARTGVIPAQKTPTGRVVLVRADVEAALAKVGAA